MNQSFGNQNQPPQTPPPAPMSNPFEAPAAPPPPAQNVPVVTNPSPNQPPPTDQPSNGLNQMFQSTGANDGSGTGGNKTWILIVILLLVLVLGGLFFSSWMGWVSLGGIEKYWKKTETTAPATPVATPTINAADKQRKIDLASLKTALVKYYQTNQTYPVAATSQKTSDTDMALNVLVPTYISSLPLDPLSPTFYYGYQSDGKTFQLTAALEDVTDPEGIQSGTYYLYKITDTSTEQAPTTSETK